VTRAALLLAAPLLLFGAVACTGGQPEARADPTTITVTRGNCGGSWSARGGTVTFQIRNAGTVSAEVYLVDPGTGGIFAEVTALAPGTARPMRVLLGRGTYAFRCLADETDAVTGPSVKVTDGPAQGAPAILPVTDQDLHEPVQRYRDYVTAGLATLRGDAVLLRDAIAHGGDARAAWLTAHLAYERLGAAYDTFGDAGDAIDGLPDGLPGGVRDPGFTGLRRIEYGLWHGEPLPSLVGPADQLVADVTGLAGDFPKEQTDPLDLTLRAHEIMENALQFELTGNADQGSGTGLDTVAANLDGTQAVLNAIGPVIQPRYAGWPRVGVWMSRVRALLTSLRGTPVAALARADRERLDAAVGQLLEVLAPVAAIGEPRRTQ
jgi:iron uptake system EfeUOB component EfeO/EfeM